MLAQPAPPARRPTVHARCTGSHAAMSDRDTTCLPPKVKAVSPRRPDSLLAWAVHPLTAKACLRTQSTSMPLLHACTPACNSAIREAGKTLGQSQSIEDPQKYEWLAQLQNRNTTMAARLPRLPLAMTRIPSSTTHSPTAHPLLAHCLTNRTRRTQQPTSVTKSARPTAPSQRPGRSSLTKSDQTRLKYTTHRHHGRRILQ